MLGHVTSNQYHHYLSKLLRLRLMSNHFSIVLFSALVFAANINQLLKLGFFSNKEYVSLILK